MKFDFYIPYRIKDFYYKLKCFFFPRNRWLTKVIPREYRDKDSLIEVVLFKCLTEFVETEIGKKELFNKNRWSKNDSVSEYQLKFEGELKDIYLIITKTIPNLEKEINNLFDFGPNYSVDDIDFKNRDSKKYLEWISKMGKINEKEEELEDIKTQVMEWCINSRRSMWT